MRIFSIFVRKTRSLASFANFKSMSQQQQQTELDRLYTCGNFTNSGRNPAEVKAHFYTILTECYHINKKNVPVIENIDYGGQFLDIWGKDPEKAEKICVFIYGGYWQEREKKYATSLVGPASDQGIPVVCISYDYATNNTMDHLIDQIGKALKFIINRFPQSKLNLTIHSAGALVTLNALLKMDDTSRFDEIIIFSGVYNLEEIAQTYIGRNINLTQETAERLSISFSQIKEKLRGKLLLIYGEYDPPPHKRMTEEFYSAVKDANTLGAKLVLIPNEDHFTLIENLRDPNALQTQEVLKFMKNN